MNYATMSENALLRTIVEEELCSYEARFGKAECPQAKKVFISKIIRLAVLFLLVVVFIKITGWAGIFVTVFSSFNLLYAWGIYLLIKFIKNRGLSTALGILPGSLNPVTNYVMILAKKNPDTKIKDIIYAVCLNTGSGQTAFLNGIPTQAQERKKKGVAIGVSVFLMLGLLGIGGYYLVPRASYTELDTGYMLKDFKLGFSVDGEVVIPDTYNGRPVVAISEGAFRGNPFMKTVELPDTILYIGGEAFKNCSLSEVSIPSTVTSIGSSAFRKCDRLNRIAVPAGVDINERAFKESPTVITYFTP